MGNGSAELGEARGGDAGGDFLEKGGAAEWGMELGFKVGDSGAGFVKGFFGHGIDLGTDLFDFFFGDDARVEEFAREQATDWGVGIDFGVEGWLSEAGFVPFVVAVAAVADEIEDNILMKALAEFEGQLNDGSGGERIVPIDVEDGEAERFSWSGAVASGAGVLGYCGKGDLVIDDNVDGAASAVALEAGEVEGFGDDALSNESAVSVNEDGDNFFAFDGILAEALAGAGLAFDDGVDGFEMAGVGSEGEENFLSGGGGDLIFVAKMVFNVAASENGLGNVVLVEFGE